MSVPSLYRLEEGRGAMSGPPNYDFKEVALDMVLGSSVGSDLQKTTTVLFEDPFETSLSYALEATVRVKLGYRLHELSCTKLQNRCLVRLHQSLIPRLKANKTPHPLKYHNRVEYVPWPPGFDYSLQDSLKDRLTEELYERFQGITPKEDPWEESKELTRFNDTLYDFQWAGTRVLTRLQEEIDMEIRSLGRSLKEEFSQEHTIAFYGFPYAIRDTRWVDLIDNSVRRGELCRRRLWEDLATMAEESRTLLDLLANPKDPNDRLKAILQRRR